MHRPYASRGFNDGAVARTTRRGFWRIMVDAAAVDVAFHRVQRFLAEEGESPADSAG